VSPASDLGELLRQLHGVRSPIEQIKLLGRGWRSVRRLTSGERRELAARLGMQELEAVLARLGRKKGGIAPAELLRLLEQADDIDPSNLGR
jgi:hypothetical protein